MNMLSDTLPISTEDMSDSTVVSTNGKIPENGTVLEDEPDYEETVEDWERQWKSEAEIEGDRDLAFWWKGDIDAINDAHFGDGYDFYAIDNAIYCTSMLSDDAYGAEDEWERAQIKDDFFKGRRKFFITRSNVIGMGPPRLQKGDIVCVFLGCSCPLIIRKENDHYILVGEAFVKGYMYGKAVYEWDESCLGQRRLTRIALH